MRELIFDLSISSEEYLKVYRGESRDVLAVSRDGLRVRFPVSILQKFLTRHGVKGSFAVLVDENNRFQSIRQL